MDDLVSKKVLIKAIENIEARYGNDNSSLIEQGEVLDLITEAPTVDAVEVVRCKDCRYCDPESNHCDHSMGTTVPLPRRDDDFCSYGERKENT